MRRFPRFGAAFLVRVGQLEAQLYEACLGDDEDDGRSSRRVTKVEGAADGSGKGDHGQEEKKVRGVSVFLVKGKDCGECW